MYYEKENYSGGGKGSVSQNEIAKCCVLPVLSLSNRILWKASVLEEESWCGAYSEKLKKLTSFIAIILM